MTLTELITEVDRRDLYFLIENKFRPDEQYRFTVHLSKKYGKGDRDFSTGAGSNDSIEDALDLAIANWDARKPEEV